jgi:glyoxylase-like metal-dependent hydrolase (beta-lactamase superfamily II)
VRAVALHLDVLVATSAIWQTNCAIVRSGEESFAIDSPILPAELEALPALVEQSRFPLPIGLLATHGDWDHLLGRLAFPGLSLGCAESTAARMRAAPGEAQRELRAFDESNLIERSRPLALGAIQDLPVPGRCGIGELELELHPAAGHTEDGMAIWVPWARVLLAGDYLSTVELPSLSGSGGGAAGVVGSVGESAAPAVADEGPLDAYVATLERLRALAQGAEHVVPGHGPVLDAERALAVIAEDLAYLQELRDSGSEAQLPAGRRTSVQRARHAENVARVQASRR